MDSTDNAGPEWNNAIGLRSGWLKKTMNTRNPLLLKQNGPIQARGMELRGAVFEERTYFHYPEPTSGIDDHCFFQQVLHCLCWLCSHFEPSLDFRCLQLCLVPDGIVPAQFLQRPTVALVLGIYGHDPVERELLPSETLEAKLQVVEEMPSTSVSDASSHEAKQDAFRTTVSRSTTHLHGCFDHRHVSSHIHTCVRILLRLGARMSAHGPPRRATAAASSLVWYVPRSRTSHASTWPSVRPASSATHLHHTCPGERGRRGAQRRGHRRPIRSCFALTCTSGSNTYTNPGGAPFLSELWSKRKEGKGEERFRDGAKGRHTTRIVRVRTWEHDLQRIREMNRFLFGSWGIRG